LNRHWKEVM